MLSKDLVDDLLVPFSLPSRDEIESIYVLEAMRGNHRHGAGVYTARASSLLKDITCSKKVLLTHSCTGALELAMLLAGIREGDEVILPSFTFSSTANAVLLRGAIPVFADIDPYTQCLDPISVESAITPYTRAIMPVHYAGISCNMKVLNDLATHHQLAVIEDAAQAIGAYYSDCHLGSIGMLGALSFHDSKNISCGEGGALLINSDQYLERAEILWEKGTNRSKFMRGEVDKYTWVDIGSSFLPSEVSAAFLLGQLERMESINGARCRLWNQYYTAFEAAEASGICQRPFIPDDCRHNGHNFYLILDDQETRDDLLNYLRSNNISATFHYVPLHTSPAGKQHGLARVALKNSERAGACLLRLPLFPDMTQAQLEKVITVTNEFLLSRILRIRNIKVG